MSHSQFHSIKSFILRHAWLNLWDKRMLLAESTRLLSLSLRTHIAAGEQMQQKKEPEHSHQTAQASCWFNSSYFRNSIPSTWVWYKWNSKRTARTGRTITHLLSCQALFPTPAPKDLCARTRRQSRRSTRMSTGTLAQSPDTSRAIKLEGCDQPTGGFCGGTRRTGRSEQPSGTVRIEMQTDTPVSALVTRVAFSLPPYSEDNSTTLSHCLCPLPKPRAKLRASSMRHFVLDQPNSHRCEPKHQHQAPWESLNPGGRIARSQFVWNYFYFMTRKPVSFVCTAIGQNAWKKLKVVDVKWKVKWISRRPVGQVAAAFGGDARTGGARVGGMGGDLGCFSQEYPSLLLAFYCIPFYKVYNV